MNKIDEFINDPLFAITPEEKQLFELTEPMKRAALERAQADFIAQRRPCENFEQYEEGFKRVHQELKDGKRRLVRFSTQSIEPGHYYVIRGVLVYLAKVSKLSKITTNHMGMDGRTLTIYENGMESNILLQTFSKSAYLDGYTVSEPDEAVNEELRSNMGVTDEDLQTGWIYVLSSKSTDPQIASIKNLYKIGFTTTPIEDRLKNCENEPTYLMAKVKVERVWRTYNLNTLKLETLIHQFFNQLQLQVRVKDTQGVMHKPEEWYIVPLPLIDQVVEDIIEGTIVGCSFNKEMQCIEQDNDGIKKEKFDISEWSILPLIIKRESYDAIVKGKINVVSQQLKPNVAANVKRYTWVDNVEGKRYLRKYDIICLTHKGAPKDRLYVEIADTTFDRKTNIIQFHLGKVIDNTLMENLLAAK